MKTIDVKTTQNVTITYELAEVRDRILAFVIDSIIKTLSILLLYWAFYAVFSDSSNELSPYFQFIIIVPISTFYSLAFEIAMNGQTPGKKLLKIKVIKRNGKQPLFYDYLLRWAFRILDVWGSLGVVGMVLIASTDNAQRLGDLSADTTVVRVNNRTVIALKDILQINTRQNYTPIYPAISNFREEDILLIKLTVQRYNKYRNEAHTKALNVLCDKLKITLGIDKLEDDKIHFLKTLIKDYIVLTR